MEYVIICIVMFVAFLLSVNFLYYSDIKAWGIQKAKTTWNMVLFGKITFPFTFPVQWFINKYGKWK